MRFSLFLLLSSLGTSQLQYPESSQDFNELIQERQYVLALFRKESHLCPECDRVLNELVDASNYIDNQDITIASVNCTISEKLCEPFNVPSDYPCLKFFDSTTVIDYYGNFDREAIVSGIRRLTSPILTDLRSPKSIKDFISTYNDTLIMFMNSDDSDILAVFASAATSLRANVTFAYSSREALNEFDIEISSENSPTILFYTTLRSDPVVYPEKEVTVANLKRFIDIERFPPFSNVSSDTYRVYVDRGLPIVWCFLAPDNDRPRYLELLKNVAAKSRSNLSWVWLDADKHYRHAVNLDLNNAWPALVVDDAIAKTKYIYPFDLPFEDNNISEWIDKVLSKQVRANMKSESPFPSTTEPLIRAVGENFMQIISDSSKDAFIVVTSKSWCGACKVVDPQVLKLAEIFKDQASILIVEIDGSLNDIPLEVHEFPSMFLYPAGNRSDPIVYRGRPYSYAAMTNFILKESQSLKESDRQAIQQVLESLSSRRSKQMSLSESAENLRSEKVEL